MNTGDHVPDFDTVDQHGTSRRFHEYLADGPVVLFFYPKAMTTGCTKESCHFRDLAGEFAQVGAQRIGISADKVEKQAQFDEKHSLGFPLISDTDKSIACQLAGLAAGTQEYLRIFDAASSAEVATGNYAFTPGDTKELRFGRDGTSYTCIVATPTANVQGTAAFAPASPQIGLRVHGAVARWRWVMLVTSP